MTEYDVDITATVVYRVRISANDSQEAKENVVADLYCMADEFNVEISIDKTCVVEVGS